MKYTVDDRFLSIDIDSLFVDTIQDFFDEYIPSKKIQHLLIQNKDILLDNNFCKREDNIVGLKLMINLYPNHHEYQKINNQIDVVYEDELVLVVNKPKDLVVHSDDSNELTLNKMVESYYFDKPYIDCLPIHRLDKDTSGLVVYSKSMVFQPLLDKMLNQKQIRRNYLAFVKGKISANTSFVINEAIGNDRHDSKKRIIYKNGQSAITKVKSLGCNNRKNYSVLLCSLDTGRTHQIRVHLSYKGFPILNDKLYGESSNLCIRMGLIASELEFYHPLKEEVLIVEANLPNDLGMLYGDLS